LYRASFDLGLPFPAIEVQYADGAVCNGICER
jgi:hypothetical protein